MAYNPFTTPGPEGVITRYGTAMGSAVTLALTVIGLMSEEQRAIFMEALPALGAAGKAVFFAVSGFLTAFLPVYAAMKQSVSIRNKEVVNEIEANVPEYKPVTILTDEGEPNITVQPTRK